MFTCRRVAKIRLEKNRTVRHVVSAGGASQKVYYLFRNDRFYVRDYHCNGHDGPSRHSEASQSFDIIMPIQGLFSRSYGSHQYISDVNQIGFMNPHQEYTIHHPVSGGDQSTVISISNSSVRDIFHEFGMDPDMEHVQFPSLQGISSSELHLQHRHLLALLERESTDILNIEERVWHLAGGAIRRGFMSARKDFKVRPSTKQAYNKIIAESQVYLRGHYHEKVVLADLAKSAAASPFHLCRIFKQGTGLSIHQYLTRLRLRESLEPLMDCGDNLSQIALAHGFSNHSHYTDIFRSEFGLSPKAFRVSLTTSRLSKISKNMTV